MVIVDTNVWIRHLRKPEKKLVSLLEEGQVRIHPMIIAEICLGQIKQKDHLIGFLNYLPLSSSLNHTELLLFISKRKLAATGIGFVDAHLLGSALLDKDLIWSYDKSLCRQSEALSCCFL